MTFDAEAGRPYRLWLRGRADRNGWANDSVFVQFSGSVNANGAPVNRIGTTAAASVNLEEASNAGLAAWGWQDNGYGLNVLGEVVPAPDPHLSGVPAHRMSRLERTYTFPERTSGMLVQPRGEISGPRHRIGVDGDSSCVKSLDLTAEK